MQVESWDKLCYQLSQLQNMGWLTSKHFPNYGTNLGRVITGRMTLGVRESELREELNISQSAFDQVVRSVEQYVQEYIKFFSSENHKYDNALYRQLAIRITTTIATIGKSCILSPDFRRDPSTPDRMYMLLGDFLMSTYPDSVPSFAALCTKFTLTGEQALYSLLQMDKNILSRTSGGAGLSDGDKRKRLISGMTADQWAAFVNNLPSGELDKLFTRYEKQVGNMS